MATNETTESAKHWQRVGRRAHGGVNIPLFSLHTAKSCGIGEFLDLLPLFPWLHSLGLDVLQLLPLNDTGIDQSPYSSISAFALNPIHLSLHAIPGVTEDMIPVVLRQATRSPLIDYSMVRADKEVFLRAYFEREFTAVRDTSEFVDFCRHHRPWLEGYVLFKSLKVVYQWQPWRSWPAEQVHPDSQTVDLLRREYAHDMDYHRFVQYLCFQQMKEVKKQALDAHVFLKGDIPICCGAESAEAWLQPELFVPGLTAGAPPDMYSLEGQNWGFPIFDWKQLERQQYNWWRMRLSVAAELYDIYRVDHIVGLFRIWAIPVGKSAKEGHFLPEDPAMWIAHGRKILQMMLDSNPMLPIGEDLGTIPPAVRVCLREMGICGTKVMRWERAWEEDGRYLQLAEYPPLSMTTVSTHDSETVSGWWSRQPQEAKLFAAHKRWIYSIPLCQQYLFEILRDSNHSASLFHINLLNEYLALIPELVWPDPNMERINIPGTVVSTNWSYRFRPSVEEIVANRELATLMRQCLR